MGICNTIFYIFLLPCLFRNGREGGKKGRKGERESDSIPTDSVGDSGKRRTQKINHERRRGIFWGNKGIEGKAGSAAGTALAEARLQEQHCVCRGRCTNAWMLPRSVCFMLVVLPSP